MEAFTAVTTTGIYLPTRLFCEPRAENVSARLGVIANLDFDLDASSSQLAADPSQAKIAGEIRPILGLRSLASPRTRSGR